MESITLEQFQERYRSQGVPREHIAFRCAICGTIQSARSLIAAGAGSTFDEVEKYLGFSCVGRFTNAGPFKMSAPAGRGCDWTLGGLLRLHELEVITPDGNQHASFELAAPDEALALMKSWEAVEP